MANVEVQNETTGGSLKNADLLRYVEENAGAYDTKKHTLLSFKNYFTAGLVGIGNPLLTPEQFADGNESFVGIDVPVFLDTLGYDNTTAAAAFPLTAAYLGGTLVATTCTLDAACSCEASLSMELEIYQNWLAFGCYGGKQYNIYFEDGATDPMPVPLPKNAADKPSNIFGFEFYCSSVMQLGDCSLFESIPADQTEANAIGDRGFIFQNGIILGSSTVGSGAAGFKIGASTSTVFNNLQTSSFDLGYDLYFSLFTGFYNCQGLGNETTNFSIASGNGVWSGGSLSNSQCNQTVFNNCRSQSKIGSSYGFKLQDSSDVKLISCTVEGPEDTDQANQPSSGIYFDDNDSTVVKNFIIEGLHAEQSYVDAVVDINFREGIYNINYLYNQIQGIYVGANTDYVKMTSSAGRGQVFFNQNAYATANMTFNSGATGCTWESYNSELAGAPATAAAWAALGATFWNGTPPAASELRIIPRI